MRLIHLFTISFILFSLIMMLFPSIDIAISSIFYDEYTQSFRSNLFLDFIKNLFQSIAVWMLLIFLLVLGVIYFATKQLNYQVIFLISTLIISAIVIEAIMKKEFGRARPRDIIEFNGDKQFTKAFEISDQCTYNCSFVSGHAGIGFYFLAFGFLGRKKRAYLPGIALGIILSYTRVAQGGHFFSDVIISGFVTFFISWLNAKFWLTKNQTSKLS